MTGNIWLSSIDTGFEQSDFQIPDFPSRLVLLFCSTNTEFGEN